MTVDLTVNGEPVPWEPFVAERDDLRAELAAERAHADRLRKSLQWLLDNCEVPTYQRHLLRLQVEGHDARRADR